MPFLFFFISAVSKAETKWEEFTNTANHIIYITEENLQITKVMFNLIFCMILEKRTLISRQ